MHPQQSVPTIPVDQIVSIDKEEDTDRTLLSQLFGGRGKRQHRARARVGSEDELLKKNRRQIDHYLRRIGALMGKHVSLNADGVAFFSFKKFIVAVEVPTENNQTVFIYTMICQVLATDDRLAALQKAMELNNMESWTRGATLGLNGEEVNLCYSVAIAGLTMASLKGSLENFLLTACETSRVLEKAKQSDSGVRTGSNAL